MIIAQDNNGNRELVLREGTAGYEIIVDGQFLMSSASGNSSVALVEIGLHLLPSRNQRKVLIAGLGLGFSLQAALASHLVAEITVVELEKVLIQWHQADLMPGAAERIGDCRVKVENLDFIQFIAHCRQQYDLIALDIDNGPDWLSHEANSSLYTGDHLRKVKELLSPDGVVTYWSADPAPELMQNLQQLYGNVQETMIEDDNGENKVIPAFIYSCHQFRKG